LIGDPAQALVRRLRREYTLWKVLSPPAMRGHFCLLILMKDHQLKPWEVLDSQVVFHAPPWIEISRQKIRLPDGKMVEDYHQVRMTDFALVVASTADGRILVERQYKHGIGKVTLVVPAGAIHPGEAPTAAAQRELLEETGYAAEAWRSLGSFLLSANYGCATAHVFTAQNARAVAEPKSGDLEEMQILLLRPQELLQALEGGQVLALSSVAAILLATQSRKPSQQD
jgi:ADP-ribose diphosphatase